MVKFIAHGYKLPSQRVVLFFCAFGGGEGRIFRAIASGGTKRGRGGRHFVRRDRVMKKREKQREELLVRLRRLADTPVNDAVKLAFLTPDHVDQVGALDLSGLTELKRTDKSVEVKFVDQVKVLEMMRELMEKDAGNAEEFFRALGEKSGAEGG